MPIIGITGGVASGKSTVTKCLTSLVPSKVYDTDICTRQLLDSDPAIREAIKETFGPDIIDPVTQTPSRVKLREIVFYSIQKRKQLEAILHPAIRNKWMDWSKEQLKANSKEILFIEIPLLFETNAQQHLNCVIVVASEPTVQLRRIMTQRKLSQEIGQLIINSQLDLKTKLHYADYVIWNNVEHVTFNFNKQIELCANLLKSLNFQT